MRALRHVAGRADRGRERCRIRPIPTIVLQSVHDAVLRAEISFDLGMVRPHMTSATALRLPCLRLAECVPRVTRIALPDAAIRTDLAYVVTSFAHRTSDLQG